MYINKETEQLYNERMRRYVTAMRGGTPDRIPVRFFYQEAAGRYAGLTAQQLACDYNRVFDATRKMAQDMGNDAVMLNAVWSNYGVGKSASWRYLHVPGVDVDENSVLQFSEPVCEQDLFMQAEEYDEFAADPTRFLLTKWFSRNTTRVKPPGAPVDYEHNLALIAGASAYANYMHAFGPAAEKLRYQAGIVSANSGMIKAPLDLLADKFRGYINTAIDVMERPEKVLHACESLMPHIVYNALSAADPDKNVPITLWAHRGWVPFFSADTFTNIYWATLKPVLEEIIAKGYQVLFYGEGNWEYHYDALLELPAARIIYHLDKGDPALASRKLKRKFAVSGGVSYDLLTRGTPEQVCAHLKELFAVLAADGGYILDASALMLSDINPENVRAAVDYTLEHGVYSAASGLAGTAGTAETADASRIQVNSLRPPGVCRSWEEEKAGYKNLTGDTGLVRQTWESTDAAAYNYIWTSVLW